MYTRIKRFPGMAACWELRITFRRGTVLFKDVLIWFEGTRFVRFGHQPMTVHFATMYFEAQNGAFCWSLVQTHAVPWQTHHRSIQLWAQTIRSESCADSESNFCYPHRIKHHLEGTQLCSLKVTTTAVVTTTVVTATIISIVSVFYVEEKVSVSRLLKSARE